MDKDEKQSKRTIARNAFRLIKFVLLPDSAGYFLWAFGFYLATGILQSTTLPRIAASFCEVRRNGTLCTDDCPDMLLLCTASECYSGAMNLTWTQEANTAKKAYNQAFLGASLNQECLNMVKFATSPVDAIHLIYKRASDTTLAVNEDCKTLSCRVLANALYLMPDLENGGNNCTNAYNTKLDATSCPCTGLVSQIDSTAEMEIDSICGQRLLNDGCGKFAGTPSWCNTTGRRLDLIEASESEALPCKTHSWQEETLESSAVSLWNDVPASESRQLQVSGDAPPWTVGAWSTCTCFEQCMPGLRTRIVQCGGSVCRGNQPESTQECTCSHCALCHAEMVLFISMVINYVQAGMAILLAIALGYFGSLNEERLIKISILSKLAGFFCKNLPMLENIGDVACLGLFSWLVIITYVPAIFELRWMEDCFRNELLKVSCWIPLLLWLCRLMLGRCAKRYTRVPPQLYSPVRRLPMGIRELVAFMRCLGPV